MPAIKVVCINSMTIFFSYNRRERESEWARKKNKNLVSLTRQCDDDVRTTELRKEGGDWSNEEWWWERERGKKKWVVCCIVVSHFLAYCKQAVDVSAEKKTIAQVTEKRRKKEEREEERKRCWWKKVMVEHVWTVFVQITLQMYFSFLDLYRLRCRTLLDDHFLLHDHMVHGKSLILFTNKY